MPSVFISYRRSDSAHAAGRLYERLVPVFGQPQVFMDVNSLRAATKYPSKLTGCIKRSDIFVVLIGPSWAADRLHQTKDWLKREIRTAIKQKIPIVPVLIGVDSHLPSREKLPRPLQNLCDWETTRIRADPNFHADVDAVIAELQRHLAIGSPKRSHKRRDRAIQLSCPGHLHHGARRCGGALRLFSNRARCGKCGARWSTRSGVPWLVLEDHIREQDLLPIKGTGRFAPFWDACVRFIDVNGSKLIEDLRLGELEWQAPGRSARFLDIGTSNGRILRALNGHIKSEPAAELWGVDLSEPMLKRCRQYTRSVAPHRLVPIGADAHRLPFPDDTFDRVVSGGCDFADWQTVLAEALRVCRPGGIVSIVTLQLVEGASSIFNSVMFNLHVRVAARGRRPTNPRTYVPKECTRLRDEQVSELFWMLTLRK